MQGDSMKDTDADKHLRQNLSGEPPRESFKQQALSDSTAALFRAYRRRSARRRAEMAAAAVVLGVMAFLGGRLSAPRTLPRNVDVAPQAAAEPDGLTVSSDLVAWLEAAHLFKRLGMEERMARAVEHAGKLLPYDAMTTGNMQVLAANGGEEVFENQNQHSILSDILGPHESVESISGIIAQSFGGNYHASKMD
jgi:hypothetical protein